MIETPTIDWAGLSPLVALLGGALLVLVVGLGRPRWVREGVVPFVAIASFGAAIGLSIWQWGERKDLMEGALRLDELTLVLTMIFCVAGIAATLLAWRHIAPREAAHGEFYCLLLSATAGMFVLVAATRSAPGVQVGSSPRGSLALLKLARGRAALSGRDYATPDDVKAVAVPALAHRLSLRPELWVERRRSDDIVRDLLERVPTPAVKQQSEESAPAQ